MMRTESVDSQLAFDKICEEEGIEEWLLHNATEMLDSALLEDLAQFAFGDLDEAVLQWNEHKENTL